MAPVMARCKRLRPGGRRVKFSSIPPNQLEPSFDQARFSRAPPVARPGYDVLHRDCRDYIGSGVLARIPPGPVQSPMIEHDLDNLAATQSPIRDESCDRNESIRSPFTGQSSTLGAISSDLGRVSSSGFTRTRSALSIRTASLPPRSGKHIEGSMRANTSLFLLILRGMHSIEDGTGRER